MNINLNFNFDGMAERMIHDIEVCRDRFQWARKEYMAARKEYETIFPAKTATQCL